MADVAVVSPTPKPPTAQHNQTLPISPTVVPDASGTGFIAQVSGNPFFSAVIQPAFIPILSR